MKKDMKSLILSLGTLALAANGCIAAFRSGPGTPVSMEPATTGGAKTIAVLRDEADAWKGMPSRFWDATLIAYRESEVFATVTESPDKSDLYALVTIEDRHVTPGPADLCSLTMFGRRFTTGFG